jgi:type IV pilus assembly protein PilO
MKQVFLELVRQKRKELLILVILLLLNCVLYAVNSAYLAPKIISSQSAWNDLRQRVAVAGKADVASVYRRGIDDLKKIATRVPVKRQFARALGELLDNASTNGVVAGAISYKPQVVKDQKELLIYNLSMSVSGSYAAIKSFLGDLQKNGELIVIDGISLSNSDPFEENVVMEIKASIYLQGREGV